ncbi:type II toxin-antitoxin system PemK/MazF family toxin [Microbacterium sediminis]|uniref:Uncharacterized protein n=1 Tax=Microbacterium sediminis TaxID=904291 RepID=A0A1B9NFJ8_9MICO|nr:type II toxin-antitoxin system PemK/MazF family toxin [Microbacterium sediminis]OCG75377.1 hypothetical protein A7J15_03070 [Microbacterium sediminis]QBR74405.1 type II toxin-antitoxin system PemK/MazF family toxin [Microbacterium sediminis]
MARSGILKQLLDVGVQILGAVLKSSSAKTPSGSATTGGTPPRTRPTRTTTRKPGDDIWSASTQTVELDPRGVPDLRLAYAPHPDRDPDAGEVVWTWVPYAENDGRGKDRPVLVIGRHTADRVYAVKLTSKEKEDGREFLPLGSGPWDSKGRPSWVDLDQLYSVHVDGMRREASALDLDRFARVAQQLQRRYGWKAAD